MDKNIQETQLVGELFRQLLEKYNRIQNKKHLYRHLKELTIIEINTILVIGNDEPRSMSEIANALGVSSGTPTVTIDRLIAKGFVERIRDEVDRRQVFIKLSAKGEEVYESLIILKDRITETLFGVLPINEREVLIGALQKLNSKVDEMLNSGGTYLNCGNLDV